MMRELLVIYVFFFFFLFVCCLLVTWMVWVYWYAGRDRRLVIHALFEILFVEPRCNGQTGYNELVQLHLLPPPLPLHAC